MAGDQSYVREFTRHSSDVLLNLNELRRRHVLTDVTLRVGGCPLQAHKAVLTACSGFFYSIFLGQGGHEVSVLTLPSSIEPAGFQALLDFMYTSRLLLTPGTVPAVLAAASYLQMEHVVESCHRFIQASSLPCEGRQAPPEPPRPPGSSPGAGSREEAKAPCRPRSPQPCCSICNQPPPQLCSHPPQDASEGQRHPCSAGTGACDCRPCELRYLREEEEEEGGGGGGGAPPAAPTAEEKPYKCHFCDSAFRYKGNLASHRFLHTGEKPYRCGICGAQFNRPANLKTHLRIHSGEKPYKCETCGSRFVQVAHLRAHVLIHTGEKPYPCGTCGSRFRHLQTLKSHLRIHTGEKPYQCEKCSMHFRHKSQLRLHLRQKHGAVTNTKIRYEVLGGPYAALC
ncbi:B-cell CLL/lymphoma 6 member B protein [Varanus komodoensis]|uniref:B-cell CLL/lymphoma 6 member B protein n=1 Tax=Varanus komodoensis TaxID=61221 RepID=UPI001CF7C181|nr:B-cell CLL/lymphoma 6 member B protein [Varanus komodoensis]